MLGIPSLVGFPWNFFHGFYLHNGCGDRVDRCVKIIFTSRVWKIICYNVHIDVEIPARTNPLLSFMWKCENRPRCGNGILRGANPGITDSKSPPLPTSADSGFKGNSARHALAFQQFNQQVCKSCRDPINSAAQAVESVLNQSRRRQFCPRSGSTAARPAHFAIPTSSTP